MSTFQVVRRSARRALLSSDTIGGALSAFGISNVVSQLWVWAIDRIHPYVVNVFGVVSPTFTKLALGAYLGTVIWAVWVLAVHFWKNRDSATVIRALAMEAHRLGESAIGRSAESYDMIAEFETWSRAAFERLAAGSSEANALEYEVRMLAFKKTNIFNANFPTTIATYVIQHDMAVCAKERWEAAKGILLAVYNEEAGDERRRGHG